MRWLLVLICVAGAALWGQSAGNAASHEAQAKAYAQQGKKAEAAAEFEKAIAMAPGEEKYPFELAQLYFYEQDFASAVRVLEAAQKRFPNSAQIELALGVGYYGQRRFDETVKAFLRTIDMAPEVPQPYVFLGKILDHAGDRLPEVTAKFAAWEKANPNNAEAPLLHAKALLARPGESAAVNREAEALLERSIALNAYSAEPYFELGCLMDRAHNYPKAAELLKKSVDLDTTNAAAHYRLARVYDRLGKKEEAAAERAIHAKLSGGAQQDLERRGVGGMAPQ